jgi:hypothetical protein
MKIVSDFQRARHRQIHWQSAIHSPSDTLSRDPSLKVEMDDLPNRMNSRIRASSRNNRNIMTRDFRKSSLQCRLHRPFAFSLALKPAE